VPDAGEARPSRGSPVQPVAGLTADEVQAVKCALELSPRAHGFTTDRWTLNRVAFVVERVTGVACRQSSELRALLDTIGWRQATGRERPGPRAMVS